MAKKGKDKQDLSGSEKWKPAQLAEYLGKNKLGAYEETILKHKVSGKLAPLVTDQDLKDMGVKLVGDRLRFRHVIKDMARNARVQARTKVIWSGEEKLYWSCYDWSYSTCCGCAPNDPSTYKLSTNHLRAKIAEPGRLGPWKVCCCYTYNTNNVDLTHVTDVDIDGVPPPLCQQICCCAKGKDIISVTYDGDKILLMPLNKGLGDKVSGKILNQIEEAQVMERD